MIYDETAWAALAETRDVSPAQGEMLRLQGAGLWAVLVSRGACTPDASPPRTVQAGMLILAQDALALTAEAACHLLAVRLTGRNAADLAAALPENPYPIRGESCPVAAELIRQLAETEEPRGQGQLVFALLCELAAADAAAAPLPPLAAAAIEDIRRNYAGLYGVEELSERLGVSKCHLVRVFGAAVGDTPGHYLTLVRIEAAKRYLLQREYSLDVVATLCGFSGANYLCRVFKKETGISPAMWRAGARQSASARSAAQERQEKELFV